MLIKRPFWQALIERAWEEKNIVWLMGIRRVGKTSVCQTLPNIEYFDCERPRIRQLMEDPEAFLAGQRGKRLVLDEIHRLENPSEILKLAADHYPQVKIVATGSSTLGASAKFKDTLTGRKREVWLTPLLLDEIGDFGSESLQHRMLFGGLPSFFASKELPEDDFREWIDAYWAKDVQEVFSVSKRYSFQKFTELLLAQSGGQFEASSFTGPCEVSRQTIANYLAVLEATFVVHVLRPHSTRRANEITMAPKVYGFDTGFVCYAKGWRTLRPEDRGLLWESCILNELHGYRQRQQVNYWRDKQGHEIDFILKKRGSEEIAAIECKFSSGSLSKNREACAQIAANFEVFRRHYPHGTNFVVSSDVERIFEKQCGTVTLSFVNADQLIRALSSAA
ncbi:MAG: AAA family ATPase [Candidatus Dependentiae bacterium]|nr:AAA family ATPase [Candidatus Dependentiae bacterium]